MILVNINPAYRSHELAYVLDQSGCRLLVAAPTFKSRDYVAMVDGCGRGPALEHASTLVARVGGGDDDRIGGRPRVSPSIAGEARADDPINIQYTSGTTGFPKGATLSHRNMLINGYYVGELCGFTGSDRICIPVPFYHCFGCVLGKLGATSPRRVHGHPAPSVRSRGHARRDRGRALPRRSTACRRCSSRELERPTFASCDLTSLRTGIMAGAPCPIEVMRRVRRRDGLPARSRSATA